jgi:hypothetical protein
VLKTWVPQAQHPLCIIHKEDIAFPLASMI